MPGWRVMHLLYLGGALGGGIVRVQTPKTQHRANLKNQKCISF